MGGRPCFAMVYAVLAGLAERGELGRRRHVLLASARGRVLEVGAGPGQSFRHYGPGVDQVVAVEPDAHMCRLARRRLHAHDVPVHLVRAKAEALPFPDRSFDTAVSVLVLCSVTDVDAALDQLHRLLVPSGQVLVLEHVRAAAPGLARWQDRLERAWMAVAGGCRPNRPSDVSLARHGFDTSLLESFDLRPSLPLLRPHVQGVAAISRREPA